MDNSCCYKSQCTLCICITYCMRYRLLRRLAFYCVIGERERANLVVRLARFFYIYIYISGNALTNQNRVNHTVDMRMRRTYVQRLRDIYTLCPFPVRRGEAVETAESGRCVYPRAELDIHVVRRREHLATDTTEERETRLSRHFAPYMHNNNVLSISSYTCTMYM